MEEVWHWKFTSSHVKFARCTFAWLPHCNQKIKRFKSLHLQATTVSEESLSKTSNTQQFLQRYSWPPDGHEKLNYICWRNIVVTTAKQKQTMCQRFLFIYKKSLFQSAGFFFGKWYIHTRVNILANAQIFNVFPKRHALFPESVSKQC